MTSTALPAASGPRVRLGDGQAALIQCPRCGVPMTACAHGPASEPESGDG